MLMSNLSFYVTAPSHFLSMLQTKKLVDVKIFDLNTPTQMYMYSIEKIHPGVILKKQH
jgi:hypothetical protein